MCITHRPRNSKRAQGRPGAGRTHGPPAIKKAGGRHHRIGRTTGLPCAMVLTVSFVLFLGTGLSCPHRRRNVSPTWHQRREARTTRFRRPHRQCSSRTASRVHRIPASRVVTIARTPLCIEAGCTTILPIYRINQGVSSCAKGRTLETVLHRFANIRLFAHAESSASCCVNVLAHCRMGARRANQLVGSAACVLTVSRCD